MYNKTSFINETDYAELVGLCEICPIMRKVTNYARNYARAYSHNSTIPNLKAAEPMSYANTGRYLLSCSAYCDGESSAFCSSPLYPYSRYFRDFVYTFTKLHDRHIFINKSIIIFTSLLTEEKNIILLLLFKNVFHRIFQY